MVVSEKVEWEAGTSPPPSCGGHLGESNMLPLPLPASVVSVQKLCEEPELLLSPNKNGTPSRPPGGVSEGQVGNLDFHPYLTVTTGHLLPASVWYQGR